METNGQPLMMFFTMKSQFLLHFQTLTYILKYIVRANSKNEQVQCYRMQNFLKFRKLFLGRTFKVKPTRTIRCTNVHFERNCHFI